MSLSPEDVEMCARGGPIDAAGSIVTDDDSSDDDDWPTKKLAKKPACEEKEWQRTARLQEETRAANLAMHGGDCELERTVVNAFCSADPTLKCMNDSVVADMCGYFYPDDRTLALGIQKKVAKHHKTNNPNAWAFRKVKGYTWMPLVAWCVDTQCGWVFDGAELDERETENLEITLGGHNARLALSGVTPLSMNEIIAFLKGEHVAGNPTRFRPHTKEYLSWQFAGKAHKQLKERIGIHLYMTHVDPLATFPRAQNGSVDVDAGDPTDTLPRKQFKTASKVSGKNGLQVPLHESAGVVDQKPTYRPYAAGAFDELIVYHFDWPKDLVHRWRIKASVLAEKGYLRTATQNGHQGLLVYTSTDFKDKDGVAQWTAEPEHYQGTQVIGAFPLKAEEAAGHMLRELRDGSVV